MTREEAKQLLPVIKAFAEGKQIQYSDDDKYWYKTENPSFESGTMYRIKPVSKYRPFNSQEECWKEMHNHPDFGWIKNEYGNVFNIIAVFSDAIKVNEHHTNYSELCERFKFMDDTPFGIKE